MSAKYAYGNALKAAGVHFHQAALIVHFGWNDQCISWDPEPLKPSCDAAEQAVIDTAREAYLEIEAVWDPLAAAYNAALEEWDRVRDVSKVNLP